MSVCPASTRGRAKEKLISMNDPGDKRTPVSIIFLLMEIV